MMMMTMMMMTTTTTTMMIVDVVPMMMWLTWCLRWWCGCHDGAKAHVADLTFPKCSEPDSFFRFLCESSRNSLVRLLPTSSSKSAPSPTVLYDFYVKSSSRCSLVRLLPTSSSKSAPSPTIFTIFMWFRALSTVSGTFCRPHLPQVLCALQFFYVLFDQLLDDDVVYIWMRGIATVSCAFCRPHLPKVLRARQFFTIFMWCRALAAVSCAFCRPHLPKELWARRFFTISVKPSSRYSPVRLFKLPPSSRTPAETETLLRQPRQPLYPKKRRVSRPTVFSSLNSSDPDLLHFPTTWWWCGCHDDVVDRMIDMMI